MPALAAKEFHVPQAYTDFDEMLAKEKIDLIDIITRMDTHRMLVEKAIARRIATIVQKPFAPKWDDAVAMTRAADQAGVFLAVHENFRFQAPLRRVRRSCASIARSGDCACCAAIIHASCPATPANSSRSALRHAFWCSLLSR